MDVVMVGTGNVALVLSQLLVNAGHTILEVYGRNAVALSQISRTLGVKTNINIESVNKNAEICFIAVSDAAIAPVAAQLDMNQTLVVHTSGATSKNVLQSFNHYGVLYPLQSLRRETAYLPKIPFFIDANTREDVQKLHDFAATLSNCVTVADDEQRLKLHLSAVLCSNFTNHLYAVTQSFCKKENIDFKNLMPLVKETCDRLQYFPAAEMQTGPAIRHDVTTIQRHLEILEQYPDISQLYALLTGSIQRFSEQQ